MKRLHRIALARRVTHALPFLLGLLATVNAFAQAKVDTLPELRLTVAQGPAFPLGKAAEQWAQRVNAAAGGAYEAKLYAGAVLAGRDAAREFGALRDGAAELAVGSALAWSAQLPAFGAYVLPWLAPDSRAQAALAADVPLFERVHAEALRAGVVLLAVAPLGERIVATGKGTLRAPPDMTGLRIRVPGNPLVQETYAALGARPESMDFAQAQAALAAGTLDGQDAPASTLATARIAAGGLRYVTRWGAFGDLMVFAVRRTAWDVWPVAQRDAVRMAAVAAAREAAAPAREEAALADLTRQGVTIIELTPTQRGAFRAAVAPVTLRWAQTMGMDLAAAAERVAAGAAAAKDELPGGPAPAPAPPAR